MIQLYKGTNTNFDHYGDVILQPSKALITMELNGVCKIELEHPIDDEGRWKELKEGAIITAPVPWSNNPQQFRINEKQTDIDSRTAYANHRFFDLGGYVIFSTDDTVKNGQQVLNLLLTSTGFTGTSNITEGHAALYNNVSVSSALCSDDENSFVNIWGGERLYDNTNVTINTKIGEDRGVKITYGHNIESINETINMDDVVTRLIPVGYDGIMLDEKWIDSPLIDNYSVRHDGIIDLSDVKYDPSGQDGYTSLADAQAEMRRQCNVLIQNGIDKPKATYDISMIDLRTVSEYKTKGLDILEVVGIGDTVTVYDADLDIDIQTRVISFTYDALTKQYESITLDSPEINYYNETGDTASRVDSILNDKGKVKGGSINGIIDSSNAKIRAQRNIEQVSSVRAVLLVDPIKNLASGEENSTYGALSLGTNGVFISDERNTDDTDWIWKTAVTSKSVIADAIITGLLAGKSFNLNLDTGEVLIGERNAAGYITSPTLSYDVDTRTLYVHGDIKANTIATTPDGGNVQHFHVDENGDLTAVNGTFTGKLTGNIDCESGSLNNGTYNDGSYNRGDYDSGNYNGGSLNGTGGSLDDGGGYIGESSNTAFGTTDSVKVQGGQIKFFNGSNMSSILSSNGSINIGANAIQFLAPGPDSTVVVRIDQNGMTVSGPKPRTIYTNDYGMVMSYAYETAGAYFGDIGEGIIAEDGACYVDIDSVILEMIPDDSNYQVFLQSYGEGCIYGVERFCGYFIVTGTPLTTFGWELKSKQVDAMNTRLEPSEFPLYNDPYVDLPSEDKPVLNNAEIYLNNFEKEPLL